MRLRALILTILIISLMGCSSGFKPDTFSEKDFAFQKVDDVNAKIHYGMTRKEVEKILGEGEESYLASVIYKNGVIVMYSKEKVVGFALSEDSHGFYKTSRGVEVGMSKQNIIELFGEKYAIETPEGSLDYMYNLEDKKLLSNEFLKTADQKYKENTYLFTAFFNEDGSIRNVYLLDHRIYK
ncbi:hypothetical protein [Paenibacillus monticola]|uniref:Lipoprotein n=1 Tax=Paenibacillus monticola TaxID=2666075 RepID=A0A7X2H2V3_9BACL|nr:hypothetical protein [Paenibacillus monticola]MRN52559.1 hypothetical protein [Paenibacillus monticola]